MHTSPRDESSHTFDEGFGLPLNKLPNCVTTDDIQARHIGILTLPTELLVQILEAVETSPTMWLNLALTHPDFASVVMGNTFYKHLIGQQPRFLQSLAYSWSSRKNPRTTFIRIARLYGLIDGEVRIFAQHLHRTVENREADYMNDSSRMIYVADTFVEALTAGLTLFEHLAFLSHKLGAPSKRSLNFMKSVIQHVLSDQCILLLRWTVYIIWFKAVRSTLHESQPAKTETNRGYGTIETRSTSPAQEFVAFPPAMVNPHVWLSRWFYKYLLKIETSLLFGPSLNMISPFCEDPRRRNHFSGPFWEFYNHVYGEAFGSTYQIRTCADGTRIPFYLLTDVLQDRLEQMDTDLDLTRLPFLVTHDPFTFYHAKGEQLEEMHLEILGYVRETDFVALGRRLRGVASSYLADVEEAESTNQTSNSVPLVDHEYGLKECFERFLATRKGSHVTSQNYIG